MDVTERQHLDAVRAQLVRRYQFLDPHLVGEMVDTAYHQFDGCRIRDFVPCWSNEPPSGLSTRPWRLGRQPPPPCPRRPGSSTTCSSLLRPPITRTDVVPDVGLRLSSRSADRAQPRPLTQPNGSTRLAWRAESCDKPAARHAFPNHSGIGESSRTYPPKLGSPLRGRDYEALTAVL
ncbi:three-helix bundle dimerization domain-containing protein [Rhodococcus jostii]|uniref:three-helix bundle dimerization domain-containing protein n=1 Tax=Rhodococcus jostii TaxID=132919 RepID=UPI00365E04B2